MTRLPPTDRPLEAANWIVAVTGLATIAWSALGIVDHRNGNSGIYDLGIFEQALWNAAHGHGLTSSVLNKHFFGEHLNLALVPLAVLYRLFSTTSLLIVVQSCWLAAGIPAVWLMARRFGHDSRASILWVAIYVLQPTLSYIAVWDFHPVVMSLPLLLWMLAAVAHERWRAATLLALSTLLVQEEMGLVILGVGIVWVLFHGRRWRGLAVAGAGAVWFGVAVGEVMPHLNEGPVVHLGRYAYLGSSLPEMLVRLLTHPVDALSRATTPLKIVSLAGMLFPLAGLCVRGGPFVLPALVPLAYNFLSTAANQFDFRAQYMSVMLPFLFVGALRASTMWKGPGLRPTRLVLFCALASQSFLFVVPPVASRDDLPGPVALAANRALVELRRLGVPPADEAVVASQALGAHLASRGDLKLFEPAASGHAGATYVVDLEASDPWPFEDRGAYVESVRGLLDRPDLRVRHDGGGLLVLEPGPRVAEDAARAERTLLESAPASPGYGLVRRLSGRGL